MMDSLFPDYVPGERRKKEAGRCKVRVLPYDRTAEVEAGTLLIDAVREVGIDVPQQCGGFAVCGWCKLWILEGEDNLSPIEEGEERLLQWAKLRPGERASCQAEVHGDVVVSSERPPAQRRSE